MNPLNKNWNIQPQQYLENPNCWVANEFRAWTDTCVPDQMLQAQILSLFDQACEEPQPLLSLANKLTTTLPLDLNQIQRIVNKAAEILVCKEEMIRTLNPAHVPAKYEAPVIFPPVPHMSIPLPIVAPLPSPSAIFSPLQFHDAKPTPLPNPHRPVRLASPPPRLVVPPQSQDLGFKYPRHLRRHHFGW